MRYHYDMIANLIHKPEMIESYYHSVLVHFSHSHLHVIWVLYWHINDVISIQFCTRHNSASGDGCNDAIRLVFQYSVPIIASTSFGNYFSLNNP